MQLTFAKKVLKLELRDTYRHLHLMRTEIFRTVNNISKLLPISVASAFFGRQENNMQHLWFSLKQRIDKKLQWMLFKLRNYQKQQIKPIKYFIRNFNSATDVTLANVSNKKTISNVQPLIHLSEVLHEVTVFP